MTRVAIAGASFGGLTLARLLQARGIECTVLEARSSLQHKRDRGVGIWPHAQAILRQPAMRLQTRFDACALQTRPAAYRNRAGAWLSLSSDSSENRARVATLTENELLSMLGGGGDDLGVKIKFGARIVRVATAPGGNSVAATCSDGSSVEAHVLIGADGADSIVARHLSGEKLLSRTAAEYVSWGGVCRAYEYRADLECASPRVDRLQAYETLGNGSRFACIPLRTGAFWFASLPATHAPTVDCARADVQRRLMNSHFPTSKGWHASIADVIARTPPDALEFRTIPNVDASHSSARWFGGRVCLLGDAAHAIASNLAQGASIAIEDAHALADELVPVLTASSSSSSQSPSAPVSTAAVTDAFAAYQRARAARVQWNRRLTAFTAALAAPRLASTEWLRDAPMRLTVPGSWLNSRVFDAALSASLGGNSWRPTYWCGN